MKAKIGIRPVIDGRWGGIREGLEQQTMNMARNAKKLIEENVFYADDTPCEVVISDCTIGGGAEAYKCAEKFKAENVTATLSVTPFFYKKREFFKISCARKGAYALTDEKKCDIIAGNNLFPKKI